MGHDHILFKAYLELIWTSVFSAQANSHYCVYNME